MRTLDLKIHRYILITLLALSGLIVNAEDEPAPPDSEVHVFDLSFNDGRYLLKNGANISNNVGYDNQPFFYR